MSEFSFVVVIGLPNVLINCVSRFPRSNRKRKADVSFLFEEKSYNRKQHKKSRKIREKLSKQGKKSRC